MKASYIKHSEIDCAANEMETDQRRHYSCCSSTSLSKHQIRNYCRRLIRTVFVSLIKPNANCVQANILSYLVSGLCETKITASVNELF